MPRVASARSIKALTDLAAGTFTGDPGVLLDRGWATTNRDGSVEITLDGRKEIAAAADLAAWNAVPEADRPNVRVRPRSLGRSSVRGLPDPKPGREVVCRETSCRNHDYGVVWFTNQSGGDVNQRAERAMRRHGLEHIASR